MHIVCCICTDDVLIHQHQQDGGSAGRNLLHPCTTPCGHVFHERCLRQWLQRSDSTCPRCRAKCLASAIVRLYLIDDDDDASGPPKPTSRAYTNDEELAILRLTEKLSKLEVQEMEQSAQLREWKRERQSLQDRLRNAMHECSDLRGMHSDLLAEKQRFHAEMQKKWASEKQSLEDRLRKAAKERNELEQTLSRDIRQQIEMTVKEEISSYWKQQNAMLSQRLNNCEADRQDLEFMLEDRKEMWRRERQSLQARLRNAQTECENLRAYI